MYHASMKIVQRSKGASALAKAAYHSRSEITNEQTGETYNYNYKEDLVHQEIIAPANAPAWVYDRQRLWNEVEQKENRKNSQLARNLTIALINEFDLETNKRLMREFVQVLVDQGMIADIAIHDPPELDDDPRNLHAHIMLTLRRVDAVNGWDPHKARDWNPEFKKSTQNGRKPKGTQFVADTAPLVDIREKWAAIVNAEFERQGIDKEVTHESYAARGLAKVPQPHVGPRQSSRLVQLREDTQALNRLIDQRAALQRPRPALCATPPTPTNRVKHSRQEYKKKLIKKSYGLLIKPELLKQVKFIRVEDSPTKPNYITLYNGSWVKDFGNNIVLKDNDLAAIQLAVDMAAAKGWSSMQVRGDQDFVELVKELAEQKGIEISKIIYTDEGDGRPDQQRTGTDDAAGYDMDDQDDDDFAPR